MRETLVETVEHRGVKVEIHRDTDAESPRESCDCFGVMVCWHSRHGLGDRKDAKHPKMTPDREGLLCRTPGDFKEWWKENGKNGILLPLFLYDHSGLTMRTGPFSCPWDSGQVGWIYATRAMVVKEFGARGRKKAIKCLEGEVETYDQYLTGDVYGYEVVAEEGDDPDSCWGFFGLEWVRKEAIRVANGVADERAANEKARVEEALAD